MKKRNQASKLLSLLLTICIVLSSVPIQAFAASETTDSVLDKVTPQVIFELIKGKNLLMDDITTDLEDYEDMVSNNEKVTMKLDSTGRLVPYKWGDTEEKIFLKWDTEKNNDKYKDYINVAPNTRGLNLLKRPLLGEPSADVVLTMKAWTPTQNERLVDLKLKIQPGKAIPTELEIIKRDIFQEIKGNNIDAGNITEDLKLPNAYINKEAITIKANINKENKLVFKSKYSSSSYLIEFGQSTNSKVVNVTKDKIAVTRQAKDTKVEIPITIKENVGNKKVLDQFNLSLTVKGKDSGSGDGTETNILDQLTEEILFTAIKGENISKDSITDVLSLPANGDNPFYFKGFKPDGTAQWWASRFGALAKIEITKSSNPDIIEVGTDCLKLKSKPEKDELVTLIFELTDLKNQDNKKTVELNLTVKASKNKLNVVEKQLFDAIKGNNVSADKIKTDMIMPGEVNPFFATATGENITWDGVKKETSNVKIEFTNSDNKELIAIEGGKIRVLNSPEIDTTVKLSATLTDLTKPEETKNVELMLTVKSLTKIEKELKGYLDKYLVPENFSYTNIKKSGVSFAEDYKNNNVRYSLQLPNISASENLPWGEVKTSVSTENNDGVKKINNYVWDPIRADVGGKSKTITLTYTLTKDKESVSRDINFTIPALTNEEIQEEIKLLEDIKKNFFEGIKGDNFDANNVHDSLRDLSEARYEDNKLVLSNSAKENKYYGFKFSTGRENGRWTVNYENGKGDLFDPSNMVLQKRPDIDTKVNIGHQIESVQLQKYAECYPDNKELQKLKRQTITTDIVVKKVDASCKNIKVGNYVVTIKDGEKEYSVLTSETLAKISVETVLSNMSANLVIAGNDCTNIHKAEINLNDGYARFGINISDCDNKNAGTEQNCDYTITVVSEKFLEDSIKRLPYDPSKANAEEIKTAQLLYRQYMGLEDSDKAKIEGSKKIEKYNSGYVDPKNDAKKELDLVESKLFDGIKGENKSSDLVYTDLEEVRYAKIEGDKVTFYKEPVVGCSIRIDWTKSSAPEYVDVHNGNDFDTRYVLAFKLNKRPSRNSSAADIKFDAKLTHMVESAVEQSASTEFKLKEYDARLKTLSIKEFQNLKFDSDIKEYTIFNTSGLKKITLNIESIVPKCEIEINNKKVKSIAEVALDSEVKTIEIKVNDWTKNTLNEKWDEKIYKITVMSSLGKLEEQINKLPSADEITKENYKSYIDIVKTLSDAFNSLTSDQKDKISKIAVEKLNQVTEKIESLKLADAKAKAIAEINLYGGNEEDYTTRNWLKVSAARKAGIEAINAAKNEDAVINALTEAKAKITIIPKKELGEAAVNTKLESVFIVPGEIKAVCGNDGIYSTKVPSYVEKITIKALPSNKKAYVKVNGEEISPEKNWTSSEIIKVPEKGFVEVTITVISSDETKTQEYKLRVERSEVIPQENINVTFELIGDSKHAEGMHDSFENWIQKVTVSVPKGSTAKYLTDKLLIENNIPFVVTAGGTYIQSINGLSEFDNGPNSGWIYNVNGKNINKTYDAYVLSEGDSVVWKYTDDYIKDGYFPDDDESIKIVKTLISEIPEIDKLTISDAKIVAKARDAYNSLSDQAKIKITEAEKAKLDEAVKKMAEIQKDAESSFIDCYKAIGAAMLSDAEKYGLTVGTIGGEWALISLSRSGIVTDKVKREYCENLVKVIKENGSAILNNYKSTENSRVILGLTSIGIDPTNVEGYNLLEPLADFNYVNNQGINGSIWALIALDSHGYDIPKVKAGREQTTREKLVNKILDMQLEDGGWSLAGATSDVDITAIVLQSLAPYYSSDAKVKVAVDKALDYLSNIQEEDGAFSSIYGDVSLESTAQVIVALTSLGINPMTDTRFIKNDNTLINVLHRYRVGNGFAHVIGGEINSIATEQGYYALTAMYRFINGQSALYDMRNIELTFMENTIKPGTGETNNPEHGEVDRPTQDNQQNTNNINEGELGKPKTGDEINMLPWIITMLLSGAAIILYRRKYKEII